MTHNKQLIRGFSKRKKEERIDFLMEQFGWSEQIRNWLYTFESENSDFQRIIDELSENPVSNYHLPYCLAPNFLVDGQMRCFPLVTEESSVVAALSKTAVFWAERGGFHSTVISTGKKGQVHFTWTGKPDDLQSVFPEIRTRLLAATRTITANMQQRGGGITQIELLHRPEVLPNYFQLDVSFETLNAMGANFINTTLECLAEALPQIIADHLLLREAECNIIMAILSNYTPDCRVKVWVECATKELLGLDGLADFPERFAQAVQIASADVSRAVTHNKGIMNGIDALVIATGNDFRAIEAGAHAFAARSGQYRSLSSVSLANGLFHFEIEIPLAVGVIGGITQVHPLAAFSLKILEQPDARQLMTYLATAGLASNFAAVRALITQGIQQGHMKMHLSNILNQLQVPEAERTAIRKHFQGKTVSYSDVENFWKGNRHDATNT